MNNRSFRSAAAASALLVAAGTWALVSSRPSTATIPPASSVAIAPAPPPIALAPEISATAAADELSAIEPASVSAEVIEDRTFLETTPLESAPPSPDEVAANEEAIPGLALEVTPPDPSSAMELQGASAVSFSLGGLAVRENAEPPASKVVKKSSTRTNPRRRAREGRPSPSFKPVDRIRRSVEGFVHRIF